MKANDHETIIKIEEEVKPSDQTSFATTNVAQPKNNGKEPSFLFSIIVCFSFLIIVFLGLIVFKIDTVITALSGLMVVIGLTMKQGYKFQAIEDMMVYNIWKTMPAMLILITVGAVVGSWISAGTIPALIYYGLKFITPTIFLPVGLVLCSIMSEAVGTSWGTASTLGIVFMGIGASLGIPPAITAGMVICGALFGDKMSPISDTTNLAPIGAGTDLYSHIHAMAKTTTPTYIITLLAFIFIGIKVGHQAADLETITQIENDLSANFNLNFITFIPVIVTLIMSLKKIHPLIAMYSGVIAGALVSIFLQGNSIADVFTHLNYGYSIDNVSEMIKPILNRGGIQSMMWTASLAIIVISLAGILQGSGYLNTIVKMITSKINRPTPMIIAAIVNTMFLVMVTGDSYSAILLTGTLFGDAFDRVGLDRSILSRCTEEGGTLFIAIVPWSTSGAYFTAVLGVATLAYLPFTILAWLNPLVSIFLASMGKALIYRDKNGNKIEPKFFERNPYKDIMSE